MAVLQSSWTPVSPNSMLFTESELAYCYRAVYIVLPAVLYKMTESLWRFSPYLKRVFACGRPVRAPHELTTCVLRQRTSYMTFNK